MRWLASKITPMNPCEVLSVKTIAIMLRSIFPLDTESTDWPDSNKEVCSGIKGNIMHWA